jgi:hypothetical protein
MMHAHYHRRFYRSAAIAVALALLANGSTVASAQEDGDPNPLDPLKACQAEADPTARLACFDAAVGAMVTAEEQGDLRVVDRETVRETRRSLFGFSLPDFGIFGDDDEGEEAEDEFDTLATTVTSVRYMTPRSFVFRIAEGDALWQIEEAPRRLLTVEEGDKVEIEKGSLSSYFVKFNGAPGVKGRRIE